MATATDTYTLQPGTYILTFGNGSNASVTRAITITEPTTITVTVTGDSGGVKTYTITGLPAPSAGYACTCPDFTKTRAALIDSSYSSEQIDADWTASNAGSDGDCKHILAVKILRGEAGSAPTDVPLPVTKPSKNNPFGKWPKL